MINSSEGRIGDDIERLFAAIIGMRAPADIGKEAGGVPQATAQATTATRRYAYLSDAAHALGAAGDRGRDVG